MKIFHSAVALLAASSSQAAASPAGFVHTCTSRSVKYENRMHVVGRQATHLMMNKSEVGREEEIRNKIDELKKQGKIKSAAAASPEKSEPIFTPSGNEQLDSLRKARKDLRLGKSAIDDYADKLGAKLGKKSKALGMDLPTTASKIISGQKNVGSSRQPKLGTLDDEDLLELNDDYDDEDYLTDEQVQQQLEIESEIAQDAIDILRRNIEEEEDAEMSEEDLMDAVSRALSETGFKTTRERAQDEEKEIRTKPPPVSVTPSTASSEAAATTAAPAKTTSGVGGSWAPQADQTEEYKPSSSGTWGVFPRPKSISKAYGGGKRVGAGVTTVNEESAESTREKLRAFREKMGIEVQSEKDNQAIIEEAISLAERAMGRGSYSVGISALEKVTQYCSAKSELGGNVFLNLAMLYEAEGRTDQALSLYATLSKSTINKIKVNAEKLLYGLEAMRFMRDEAKIKEFSRRKVADTFIDATGFKDMSSKFDDVYNTAYLDLEKGQYYRILTENVVRSTREARQILLKAVASGEVERLKVVQALRSISRHFDDALGEEKKKMESTYVPVDYAGRPIVGPSRNDGNSLANSIGLDGFILSEASQTLENLEGSWKLQLMADRTGEGVEFFDTTPISQVIDTSEMMYQSISEGIRGTSQSGGILFDGPNRILSREGAKPYTGDGGNIFFGMFGGNKAGRGVKMSNVPQQVLSVDSVLLITRAIVKVSTIDNVKDYYSVWRKVEE